MIHYILAFCLFFLSPLIAEEPVTYDVVIVGGGVSGSYCAWRLAEQGLKNIHLMESSYRIGGRLFSIAMPEMPDHLAEIGGMRYFEAQENIHGLVQLLGLHPYVFGAEGMVNLIYVRRERFNQETFLKKRLPFNLRKEERGKSLSELVALAIYRALPELKNMDYPTIKEYLKIARYQGRPLWQTGYLNLLMSELSVEAFHLLIDAGGYNTPNTNAYDELCSFFRESGKYNYYSIQEGMNDLPNKLVEQFVQKGGSLNLGATVVSLLKEGELIKITYQKDGKLHICYAEKVILALPKRAIELLNRESFFFADKTFVADLQRVTGKPTSKAFFWYDNAWWQKLGLKVGSSRTDLPLRQCYYSGTEGLLLASFNDGPTVSFWQAYYPAGAFDHERETFFDEKSFIASHQIPDQMILALTKQLSELHGVQIPQPKATLFKNWAEDPYGGGWHYWNPHNQSWLVIPRMRNPIAGTQLYICGEAYAADQGWAEGAINSAEKLLEEHFHLPRPTWISPTYDLGP